MNSEGIFVSQGAAKQAPPKLILRAGFVPLWLPLLAICSPLLLLPLTAGSQSSVTPLSTVRIYGESADTNLGTSPKTISKERLEQHQFTDVTRALKQTPGIYTREEEGQGLRPNIGLRGTNPDRSKKIVLMEDGILIGPAPYSAPAAYFSPDMNHVEGLEIFKGFSAITLGPNSVGGGIGYISTAIPLVPVSKIQSSVGSYGTSNLKLSTGSPTAWGGYLLQVSRLESHGFKKIESSVTSGFQRSSALGKVRFKLPSSDERREHALEFRLGYGTEHSDETYLGLTQEDFRRNALSRYSSSALDNMKWNHKKFQIQHRFQMTETSLLETSLYRHEFARVWYRVDGFRDGTSLRDVFNNPESFERHLGIVRGDTDSSSLGLGARNLSIRIANNDRSYLSQGIQTKYSDHFSWEEAFEFSPEFSVRLHQDGIRRTHSADYFAMESRTLVQDESPRELTTLNSEVAHALTLSSLLPLRWMDWTITPAVRFEQVRFEFKEELNPKSSNDREDRVLIPGVSLQKNFGSELSLRGSVNQASTIAGLSSTGNEVREQATNYELEMNFASSETLMSANITAFLNDYLNLTETCTTSGGCSANALDSSFSGGQARISGIESGFSKGFELGHVFVPIQLNVTLIQARFRNTFTSDSPTWGQGPIESGDPLPYVPDSQISFSAGTEWSKFKQEATLAYQGITFDQSAAQGRKQISPYTSLDWTGAYEWSKATEFTAKVENVFDSRYVVAARPFGLRPGKPLTASLGVKYVF